MQGRPLPQTPNEFEIEHLEFIHLRSTEDLDVSDLVERLSICQTTVYQWLKHEPFQEAILARWEKRTRANKTLAQLVHNRLLIELEVRTREKRIAEMTLKDIQDSIRAVKDEQTGTTVNVWAGTVQAAGGSLVDICAGERKEIERTQGICDPGGDIGSLVAGLAGDRAVPATRPPRENGSQN